MNIKDLNPNSLVYNAFRDLYCRDCGLIPYEPLGSFLGLGAIENFNNWTVVDKEINKIHSICPTCARRRKIKKIKQCL